MGYKSWIAAIFLVVVFFALGVLIGAGGDSKQNEHAHNLSGSINLLGFFTDSHRSILNLAIPILGLTPEYPQATYSSGDKLVQKIISSVTSIDLTNPKSFLGSEIAFIKTSEMEGKDVIISESPGITEDEKKFFEELERRSREAILNNSQAGELAFGDKPLVLIYNTHNSETYEPTDGVKKIEGENAGVEKVAAFLEEILLERHGIKSVRSTKIHDYPSWERSYVNSEQTVKSMLKDNPSVQIVLDIHRDAGLPEKGVIATSTGHNMAKILLIVGSDSRLPHPNWQKNWQFAKMVGYKMDKIYPGLLKAVRVQSGRYNQHLHERSLLVEVGCTQNTLEEALLSAEALADIIKEVLIDLRQENTF
ncbi:stage II sporulation protein P [Desulfitibacter alkalitolerans]|uniref:stage II sporulation protein P n=1 Tax=Desulfitibacter alkalitolerans TaxID=264641 RepID=UPI000687E681|nr:stage II sporulation protein P [Desulfitibacter alkalitolerans]